MSSPGNGAAQEQLATTTGPERKPHRQETTPEVVSRQHRLAELLDRIFLLFGRKGIHRSTLVMALKVARGYAIGRTRELIEEAIKATQRPGKQAKEEADNLIQCASLALLEEEEGVVDE